MSPKSLCFVPARPLPLKWRAFRRRLFAVTLPLLAPKARLRGKGVSSMPASTSQIRTGDCALACRDVGRFLSGGIPLAWCFSAVRLCGSIRSYGGGSAGKNSGDDGATGASLVGSNAGSQGQGMMNSKIKLEILLTLALPLALALLQSGCSDSRTAEVKAATRPVANQPVTNPAPPAEHEPFFIASGPLIVEHQVDVDSQRDGVVAEIHAEPGLLVRTGQFLAQLDDRQITADLNAARAHTRSTAADLKNWESEAKVLEADAQRARKMWDAQLITQEQFDHARFKAESDQWDVRRVQEWLVNAQQIEHSLELELEKTRIRAPFSGVVARRYVRVGQQVNRAADLVSAEA